MKLGLGLPILFDKKFLKILKKKFAFYCIFRKQFFPKITKIFYNGSLQPWSPSGPNLATQIPLRDIQKVDRGRKVVKATLVVVPWLQVEVRVKSQDFRQKAPKASASRKSINKMQLTLQILVYRIKLFSIFLEKFVSKAVIDAKIFLYGIVLAERALWHFWPTKHYMSWLFWRLQGLWIAVFWSKAITEGLKNHIKASSKRKASL